MTHRVLHPGKTTLLDVLAGRIRGSNLQGEVFLNGKPDRKHLRRCSQYVMQEDVFVATQTVLETLKFRAGLCMPSAIPQTERLQCIASVLDVMGLAKVGHSKVASNFLSSCLHGALTTRWLLPAVENKDRAWGCTI